MKNSFVFAYFFRKILKKMPNKQNSELDVDWITSNGPCKLLKLKWTRRVYEQCDQMLELKVDKKFKKLLQRIQFLHKSDDFRNSLKSLWIFGLLLKKICCQELKIAQSGHTVCMWGRAPTPEVYGSNHVVIKSEEVVRVIASNTRRPL